MKIDVDTFCRRLKKLHEHWQVRRRGGVLQADDRCSVMF